jgi:hypothetical protein
MQPQPELDWPDLLDPQPMRSLSDPALWLQEQRLGSRDLGALMMQDPVKAAETLASMGVPPPTGSKGVLPWGGQQPVMSDQIGPSRADLPIYQRGGRLNPFSPEAKSEAEQDRARRQPQPAATPMKQQDQLPPAVERPPSYVPPGAETSDQGQGPFPNAGSELDPVEGSTTGPATGRGTYTSGPSVREPGAQPNREPTDFAKVLQGLKAIAPPAVVQPPAPQVPRADTGPSPHFAPAPHTAGGGGQAGQLLQHVLPRMSPATQAVLLSQLLGRR